MRGQASERCAELVRRGETVATVPASDGLALRNNFIYFTDELPALPPRQRRSWLDSPVGIGRSIELAICQATYYSQQFRRFYRLRQMILKA
jgi:hypothetical protein